MPNNFQEWMDHLKASAHNEHHKGTLFERFMVAYLQTDPLYAEQLEHVWLYSQWPDRPEHWQSNNIGIDLVAKTHAGEYWAIQCKFYGDSSRIPKDAITNFTSDSQRVFLVDGKEKTFAYRLFVATQDELGRQAEEALTDMPNLSVLYLRNLEMAPIDWPQFSWDAPETLRRVAGKSLRPHQREAVQDVLQGFEASDRGKLIMACGTGKTFTSLQIMQKMVPEDGLVLFLAPSITLVSQTLREWCDQASPPLYAFVVCSDSQVGQEEEDIRTADLAYPATTDPQKIAQAIRATKSDRRRVIFSTYQSIQKVIEAQKIAGLPDFDLVICDEAHRTTGLTIKNEEASEFVKVHQQDLLRARKRLYMTATPRIFTEKTKSKAGEKEAILYSMDDEAIYGPEFHSLSFGESADRGILAEYKVILVAMREEAMAELANEYNAAFKLDDKKAITTDFATRIIGAWKGLANQDTREIDGTELGDAITANPMKRAVAFSRSIKASEQLKESFASVVRLSVNKESGADQDEDLPLETRLRHVDGSMGMGKRLELLDWLKEEPQSGECRVLTNARCLSEGVDVPALDAVIFFDARDSMVDIVQAVGRVMRKAPGKEFGYVILPIAIPSENVTSYDSYIDKDPRFKSVWKILKALRAHDERLVDKSEYQRRMTVMDGSGTPGKERKQRTGNIDGQMVIDLPDLPVDQIRDALYAVIPKHLGDTEYWASWAQDVARIAETIILRIESLIEKRDGKSAFNAFLKAIRKNLNSGIGEAEAVEMLAQHVLTRPIFDALFGGNAFSQENPVSQAMQRILDVLDKHEVNAETEQLDRFYKDVAKRVFLAKSDESRQDLIRNLYDTFFKSAFPSMAERLGIVYTPVEIVDFILNSVQDALKEHFHEDMNSPDVQVLDPFTGTGTFITRLLQSDLIDAENLPRKYAQEIHANELVLLAYYIAAINIESAYHARAQKYRPFDGIVLTDTFQMDEPYNGELEQEYLRENSARVERQRKLPIRVIVGNPPYSMGQENANDNNQNQSYPNLDAKIAATYVKHSTSPNKRGLYDSYIRAFRWASDRIQDRGVVCFVTNGGWLDGNTMDGFRKCLTEEFSEIYVFNLRGNQRTSGELSKKEGGKIFGSGSRTPVAITLLIKDPVHTGIPHIHYHDIGDYLSREEKLAIVAHAKSAGGLSWDRLEPNDKHDWINQRGESFGQLTPFNDAPNAIFAIRSLGISTNRDSWVYNLSKKSLTKNVKIHLDYYNTEVVRIAPLLSSIGSQKERQDQTINLIRYNEKKCKWTDNLIQDAARGINAEFSSSKIVASLYRPFSKTWLYKEKLLNSRHYRIPSIFPTPDHENLAIQVTGTGSTKDFSCLMVNILPDLEVISKGQCFPLYFYEKASSGEQASLLDDDGVDGDGYVRRDGITDRALADFRTRYQDETISKEDIFYYCYGILHSPSYREEFANDLKKELPRVPMHEDFRKFAQAGRTLADLHLHYESIEPWPLEERWVKGREEDYSVDKIKFPKKGERDSIVYNHALTLAGIPEEAYEYVVNGKSPVEWVMERYSVRQDKESGIVNDPNLMLEELGNPRYIVDLIKRLVRVSVETVEVVSNLSEIK